MSRLGGAMAGVTGAVVLLVLGIGGPTYAGGLQHCLDQAVNHNGEPPTCTKGADGTWVASWPNDRVSSGSGFAGVVGFFVILGVVAAIGTTVWRVTTAQKLARQSGMDPSLATRMTLLSDDGLDATYLAANLRQPHQPAPTTPSAPASAPAASRLAELQALLDQGLVTPAEYDERRRAIIDSV